MLCLGGGSGLSPLLAIARRALVAGFGQPMTLILSVRERSEAFALDALHALARRHANFTYRVTLTRAREGTPGWRLGRIPDWLGEELPDLSTWHVLAAGAPAFVDACVAAARSARRRPRAHPDRQLHADASGRRAAFPSGMPSAGGPARPTVAKEWL